jgi:hypothetical protein
MEMPQPEWGKVTGDGRWMGDNIWRLVPKIRFNKSGISDMKKVYPTGIK